MSGASGRGQGWVLRRRAAFALIMGLGLAVGLSAARSAPAAANDEQVLERRYLPAAGDRFQQVDFTCWLPAPGRPVRAVIIHQHGCGNSSAVSNPPVARDVHWQALARQRDCAILVPHYTVKGECAEWNDPDSGSERALFAALKEFAARAGRPELETAPWILWGHSGGSSWSVQMIVRHPGRVLAASLRGGAHKQFGESAFRARFLAVARDLPLLFVWGRGETVPTSRHFVSWDPMQAMYRELRSSGGRVALALDPRTEHDCGDSRLLVLPYFDAVLAAREKKQAVHGVIVNAESREIPSESEATRMNPAHAWLPSEPVAGIYRQFVDHGTVKTPTPPRAVPRLQAEVAATSPGVTLRWQIVPELDGGVRTLRVMRDGVRWKEMGIKAGGFLATGRDSPPRGLFEATLVDDSVRAGETHTYRLSFLDVSGAESPASPAVEIRVPGGGADERR